MGFFATVSELGLTKDPSGDVSLPRSVLFGGIAGALGAVAASPFYMVIIRNCICNDNLVQEEKMILQKR